MADGEVRLFSRTRDEITESFPELPPALAGLAEDAILDGEIVAWEYGSSGAEAPDLSGSEIAALKRCATQDQIALDVTTSRDREHGAEAAGKSPLKAKELSGAPRAFGNAASVAAALAASRNWRREVLAFMGTRKYSGYGTAASCLALALRLSSGLPRTAEAAPYGGLFRIRVSGPTEFVLGHRLRLAS